MSGEANATVGTPEYFTELTDAIDHLRLTVSHLPGSADAYLKVASLDRGAWLVDKVRHMDEVLTNFTVDLHRHYADCESMENRLRDIDGTLAGLRRLFGDQL
jgi:hypothetical protein